MSTVLCDPGKQDWRPHCLAHGAENTGQGSPSGDLSFMKKLETGVPEVWLQRSGRRKDWA